MIDESNITWIDAYGQNELLRIIASHLTGGDASSVTLIDGGRTDNEYLQIIASGSGGRGEELVDDGKSVAESLRLVASAMTGGVKPTSWIPNQSNNSLLQLIASYYCGGDESSIDLVIGGESSGDYARIWATNSVLGVVVGEEPVPFGFMDIADTDNHAQPFARAGAAGFTGNGDADDFQREAAEDVLRDSYYHNGAGDECVLLEDSPTACALVAPSNIVAVPDVPGFFAAEWDAIPVTASLLRYEWRLDDTGAWTSNGTDLVLPSTAASAGTHTLNVRAVSTSVVAGATGDSPEFEVEASGGSRPDPALYGTCTLALWGDDAPSGSIATWPFDTYGFDAVQADSGARPTRVDSAINGHHAVAGDGTDWMELDGATSGLPPIRTLFIVLKHNDGNQDYGHFFGNESDVFLHGGVGTDLHYSALSGSFASGTFFVNGAADTITTVQKPTTFKLLSYVATSSQPFTRIFTTAGQEVSFPTRIGDFTIAAIIGFSDALDDTNRENFEDELGDYFGLTITH